MLSDRTHPPCPDGGLEPLPSGAGQPRRRGKGVVPLILSLSLIVVLAGALAFLRTLPPIGWDILPEGFSWSFSGPGFYYGGPGEGDFYEGFDSWQGQSGVPTTIPRGGTDAGVRLALLPQPEAELSVQEIYEKVAPSIVAVQAHGGLGSYEGTGVVMTADGYVITNHHIIAGCSSAQVVLSDGTAYDALLVGSDVESDLAVLKVDCSGLTPAQFGDSELLRVGDAALALGNPLGSELFGTLTDGIISAINRNVSVDGYDMSLLQTTAALNPGNSGGALINRFGQVVGITNLKMMSSYETIEGLGFAIPSAWVKEVVDALLARGAITGRPTIGITCLTIPPGEEERYGRDSGVYIDSVTPHGPAAEAGAQAGDVIVAANDRTVTSLEDLTLVRDETGVGGKLKLTVWRGDRLLELNLTLVEQHELN